MKNRLALLEALHKGLAGRPRPEVVAKKAIDLGCGTSAVRIAARSTSYIIWSSMSEVFDQPVQPTRLVETLRDVYGIPVQRQPDGTADLRSVADIARKDLGLPPGPGTLSYRADRLPDLYRRRLLPNLSRRRYNRLFRLTARLEKEAAEYAEQMTLFRLNRIAKTSYAADLSFDDFASDEATAVFVAYMAANLGRRSEFTSGPQARAFDDVAENLFTKLDQHANWFVVAHVFPRADVLDRLTREQKLVLLNMALGTLSESARLLKKAWEKSGIDARTLVVRSGNNSSTWNSLAGAWNRGRDFWTALITALGLEETFDSFLPGKGMRLMAADVAWWHRDTGGDLHGDTAVWRQLPYPWSVMEGAEVCTRQMVEDACRSAQVDPEKTGWTAPRARTAVDVWRPTPELVHGVSVGHPSLAAWLRKIGAFSGKAA